jgi:uncharacterized membrane protein YbhN (UPF0104 family)
MMERLNDDYRDLMKEKSIMKMPVLWGIIWIVADIAMFEVTLISMGTFVDPFILLLAYGAACAGSFFVLTPGGTGAYEAFFILVIVAGGVSADVASAGVLLTRVILVIGTLASGYYFYHRSLKTDGEYISRRSVGAVRGRGHKNKIPAERGSQLRKK